MSVLSKASLAVVLGAIGCAGGCVDHRVGFLSFRCETPKEGERLKGLVFITSFEAWNLQDQQLVYEVRLFDADRNPLRSRDGSYQAADGTVAATTSMIVHQSPQRFDEVRVTIPARELSVPPNHPPAFAEIVVLKSGVDRVGSVWCPIPPLRVVDIMPRQPPPPPVPYWFVKVTDPNRLPVLLGPYAAQEEAAAAATGGTEPPIQVNSDEYLWFVPLYNPQTRQEVLLVGPSGSEGEARSIVALFEETPSLAPKGLIAGAPVKVQVRQWLKDRELGQAPSSRPAEAAEGAAAGHAPEGENE